MATIFARGPVVRHFKYRRFQYWFWTQSNDLRLLERDDSYHQQTRAHFSRLRQDNYKISFYLFFNDHNVFFKLIDSKQCQPEIPLVQVEVNHALSSDE